MNVKNGNRTRRTGVSEKAKPIRTARKVPFAKQGTMRANVLYLKLATAFPIRPLSSEADLDQAIRVIDRLLSRKKSLDQQEQGYFESLSHEIERYESLHVTMPDVSGAAMLRHLIDSQSITVSELATKTGIAISTLSSVLHGKRELNRRHIEKLAPYFGVSPGVFLG